MVVSMVVMTWKQDLFRYGWHGVYLMDSGFCAQCGVVFSTVCFYVDKLTIVLFV